MNIVGNWRDGLDSAVLIPCYNDIEGLKKTLNSLDGDCYFNVLIVDDGSQVSVANELKFESYSFHLSVLSLTSNSGIVTALNTGLQYLINKGCKFCFRLDCCDLHIQGRFEKQREFAEKKGLSLVGGGVTYFNESGKELSVLLPPTNDVEIKKKQCYRSCFIHPAVMIDLEAIKVVGIYSASFKHAEDYDLFFRITKKFKVGNIEDLVVRCLIRDSGLSLSNRRGQIFSVLKSQLSNAELTNPYTYFGILKTVALYCLPRNSVEFVKSKIFKVYGDNSAK